MRSIYLKVGERLRLASMIVLAIGVCAAALVYLTREPTDANILGYQIINGVSYPVTTSDDRRYQFEVERMGGKMGLLIAQFNDWFTGLWHGRTLAYTLGVITVAVVLLLRVIAREVIREGDFREAENRP
ncbi:MAG: hypothetical protein ABSF50_00165 [Burkholderiaceae bacterium]|jgi:hypothetical protein